MSVSYFGSTYSSPNLYKYLNENIIQPTKLLIKQETKSLTLDNNELRRNNEDLAKRIEQMCHEFDLVSGSNICPTNDYSDQTDFTRTSNKKIQKNQNDHMNAKSKGCGTVIDDNRQTIRYSNGKTLCNPNSGTLRSFQSSSPVYLDIFDNSGMASHYKASKMNKNQAIPNRNKGESSPIYSEINGTKSGNQIQDQNQKSAIRTLEPTNAINQLHLPSVDLTNLSESQKTIIDMLSKNSDILARLHRQDSLSPRPKSHENIQTSFNNLNSASSNTESSRTNLKLSGNNTVEFQNENSYSNESNDRRFEKFCNRNLKTESLADVFSLVLTKSDEFNVEFDDTVHKVNSFKRGIDIPDSNSKIFNKSPNSLDFHANNSMFSRSDGNYLHESKFSLPVIPESVTESNDENISPNNQLVGVMNSGISTSNCNKKKKSNLSEIDEFKNDDHTMVIAEPLMISNVSFPQLRLSSRISNQVVDDNVLTYRTSTDNEDRTYSNDLESSYETLYDPVVNSKINITDENIIYV